MQIKADKREYSRYSPDYAQITATVTSAPAGASLVVALVRDDGYGDVVTRHITADSGGKATAVLSLVSDTPATAGDRTAIQDGINYVRQGRYHLEARGGSTVSTGTIFISAIPVEEFRRSYLFGVQLYAEQMFMPVRQPQIAGVTITYVDNGMMKGTGALVYTYATRSLSWRDGGDEQAVGSAVQTLRLLTREMDAYLEVEVDPASLPTADASDTLLIDNWRLGDDDLRRYLSNAYTWVEQQLQLRLETTLLTSDPTTYTGHYDEVADAEAIERGQNRTIRLHSPLARPLMKVIELAGYYAGQKALTIPQEWITIMEKAALIELVPITGAALITPMQATWGWNLNALRTGRTVQDFWHYTIISGLRSLDGGRYSIREAIAKKAALDVLTDLSVGAAGGRTSRSAEREGVSESWSYGGGGVYGEKTQGYADWLKTYIPKLRKYHTGPNVVVL